MTVSEPPRRPSPAGAACESKPLERDEIEAVVEALIEEARRETRRRHRTYWAAAALAAVAGAIIPIVLEGGAASQTSSPAAPAQMNAAAQAGTPRLAFTGGTQGRTSELYVVNADGSEKRLLARRATPGFFGFPAWSPDGQTIAVAGLFINADGSGQRNVARDWGLDGLPVWSPNGRKIAFQSGRDECHGEIYVMNADGRGLRRLTRNGLPDGQPMWSPSGRRIAFLRY